MSRLNGTEFLNRLNYEKIKVILVSEEIQLINEVFSNDYKNIKKIYIKPFEYIYITTLQTLNYHLLLVLPLS